MRKIKTITMNCPLCGSDVIIKLNQRVRTKIKCPDKECPAHKHGLRLSIDPEGIGYLGEEL